MAFRPDPTLYPFQSRWFQTSAGRLHYIDEGPRDGLAILFCHGNPMWSFLYRGIICRLRGSARCIAADMHGFGLSDRPPGFGYTVEEQVRTLGELVDGLGLDDFILVGHDWGGPVGTAIAVERSERVRGIALGNTFFWPLDTKLIRVAGALVGTRPVQRVLRRGNLAIEHGIPRLTASRLTASELEHYRAVQATPEARVGMAALPKQLRAARPFLAALEPRVAERLGDTPALIVWGMKDPLFKPEVDIPRMASAFSDVEIIELANAKHFIQEDAPKQIAEAIARRFGINPVPSMAPRAAGQGGGHP